MQGSLEAITEALNKQSTEKVRINVVHGGTGAISESDIMLASASQAIIIGFNVRPTSRIKDIAERENVDIRFYDIIYKLVDDIKSAMAGLLAPVQREVYLGQAEVRNTFSVPKVGIIAGSYVADGKIARNAGVRLLPRRRGGLTPARSAPSSASRTTPAKWSRATNAAWAWKTSTTSRSATSSKPSRPSRKLPPCKPRWPGGPSPAGPSPS